MKRIIIVLAMCLLLPALGGCVNGPFVNTYQTEQLVQGPDGRVMRSVTTHHQDMSGTVAANATGLAANVLANGANAAIATNFGQNYSSDGRILEGLTMPGTNWDTNWGTLESYGSYGYGHGGSYGFW